MQQKSIALNTLRWIALALNSLSLIGIIIYLVNPSPYLIWNSYGYIILLTLTVNIATALIGGAYRYLDYCCLLFITVSMLVIPLLNTLASSNVQNKTSQSVAVFILYILLSCLSKDYQKSAPYT